VGEANGVRLAKLEVTEAVKQQAEEILGVLVEDLVERAESAEERAVVIATSAFFAIVAGKTSGMDVDEVCEVVRDFWEKVSVYKRQQGEVPS